MKNIAIAFDTVRQAIEKITISEGLKKLLALKKDISARTETTMGRVESVYAGEFGGSAAPSPGESFASGTGPAGLPRTGWFFGHKGEIVKDPQQSAQERQGMGGGGDTYNFNAGTVFGDDRAFESKVYRAMKNARNRMGPATAGY